MKKMLICGVALWLGAMNANAWAEETATVPVPVPVPAPQVEEPEPTIINERYEIWNGGTEIHDLKTTLVWQRCSVG